MSVYSVSDPIRHHTRVSATADPVKWDVHSIRTRYGVEISRQTTPGVVAQTSAQAALYVDDPAQYRREAAHLIRGRESKGIK